ncbi:MAG: G5 domain-containing protein [Thermoflavifilum sp.]|nr:G5 domain-containing protein [Thermoflavifilum sp.]MCL6514510.1 G5 domain-containing protein [Alicyclobacillus sp.]
MRRPGKALYASAAAAVLLAAGLAGFRTGYKTVTVQDGAQRRVMRGWSWGNVRSFLEAEGVRWDEHDRVHPDPNTPVESGMVIVIEHPAEVTLVDGPNAQHVYTFAKTWGDVLRENQIKLGPYDAVRGELSQPVRTGDVITILRAQVKTSTRTQDIPFQTLRRPTSNLYVGQQRVLTYGVKGSLQIRSIEVWRGGKVIARKEERHVVKQPVTQVVLYGTKPRPMTITARDGSTMLVARRLTVVATAYAAGGRTATGDPARPGIIAVDPRIIPLGSRVYIPGLGVMRADDTGRAIVGNRIDICMPNEAAAERWGVRTITIYILAS